MFQGIIYPRLTLVHRFGCNSDSMFNIILNIKIQHFYDFQANRDSDIILVLLRNNAILQNKLHFMECYELKFYF